jgi:glycine oxidase
MTSSALRPSSVVLGAGLMGRLLAWQLARAGHAVTIFEAGGADAQGSPARIAAAMLAPLAESAITEPGVVEMGRHALTRWPELLAQLSQPVFFQQEGTLILWHRQDAAEASRFARQLQVTNEKIPALSKPQSLDAAGVTKLEPSLGNRFAQGLYLPGEGQLDNRQLLAALLHELQALQVGLHWNSPRAPQDFQPGTAGQPDWVFDCRGLGAREQWEKLRGVRGEVARLHAPEVSLSRPTRLIHPRYPIYIAPKQDHVFVIGATEIESDDLSPPSVRSTLELLSAAYSVHTGFAEARILEIATQCRPTLPDNLPAIRQIGPRVLQINGLYRHGFMISPALLDVVLALVRGETPALAATFNLQLEALQN